MSELDNTYKYKSGKINDYLHLVDIKQFNRERVFSVFIAQFDDSSVILDCGSSLDINRLVRYMKRNGILLSSVKYIIPTHHHFDHSGGLWKLYDKIKQENTEVKILCSSLYKNLINNFDTVLHFKHVKKTFGGLIGEIRKISDEAFKILKSDQFFSNDCTTIENFTIEDKVVGLSVLETPGHAPDHVCPMFIINDQIDFLYFGGALGVKNHRYELITTPSCSAPNFVYEDYMRSVDTLRKLEPISAGFSHAGCVLGIDNIKELMKEHKNLMKEFREMIINYYREKPETKHVFDKIFPWFMLRTDVSEGYIDNEALKKLVLSIVYGMMVDLGYRDASQ